MAKTITKSAKSPSVKGAGTKAVTKTTTAKGSDLDALSVLAGETKAYEDIGRSQEGGQNSFISVVNGMSKALIDDDPRYVKGARLKDFIIASKKLNLGAKVDVAILGMFKVYEEKAKKDRDDEMAATVGFWMPSNAEQVPLMEGDNFTRQLPSGNVLVPTHWVYVYLYDHPEIEDALFSFRSIGNKFYRDLMKIVKAESSLCAELRFTVGTQSYKHDKYKSTSYYPLFEKSGRNFTFKDGKVLPEKGMRIDELKEILERSKKFQEDYASMKLIANRSVPSLPGAGRKALPAGKGYEDSEEEAEQF